jgi:hypothetical protein
MRSINRLLPRPLRTLANAAVVVLDGPRHHPSRCHRCQARGAVVLNASAISVPFPARHLVCCCEGVFHTLKAGLRAVACGGRPGPVDHRMRRRAAAPATGVDAGVSVR